VPIFDLEDGSSIVCDKQRQEKTEKDGFALITYVDGCIFLPGNHLLTVIRPPNSLYSLF
jgi:hypothetical protein